MLDSIYKIGYGDKYSIVGPGGLVEQTIYLVYIVAMKSGRSVCKDELACRVRAMMEANRNTHWFLGCVCI